MGSDRHFLCRMNFSNVFVDFSFFSSVFEHTHYVSLDCSAFSVFTVWVRQWRLKAIANTSKYARWKNFSYNTFLVDVTLAVCELSQKSCKNVNLLVSAVPKGFLARVIIPMISVEPPLCEMFFFVFPLPNSLRTQATSWNK